LTRKGLPLSDQSLDEFFRNSFYAGVLVDPWSSEEYQGQHVPMITLTEFARVQEIMARRNRSISHHRYRSEFPLRGYVRCPQCNSYMTSSSPRGRTKHYGYYHCFNRTCTSHKSYPAATIHTEFRKLLSGIAPMPGMLTLLKNVVVNQAEERRATERQHSDRQREKLNRVSTQIKELIRMRAQEMISDQEFVAEREALNKKQ